MCEQNGKVSKRVPLSEKVSITKEQLKEIGLNTLNAYAEKHEPPLYSKFSTTVEVYFKEHEYQKVDTKYRKSFKRYASGESSWLESEDIGLFIPVESSRHCEDTLQEVIKKALNVEWTPKYSDTKGE